MTLITIFPNPNLLFFLSFVVSCAFFDFLISNIIVVVSGGVGGGTNLHDNCTKPKQTLQTDGVI